MPGDDSALAQSLGSWNTDIRALLTLAIQIARAVAEVHRRGVIHGDIHPGNVVISGTGAPVIIDFDMAALMEDRASATPAEMVGALAYMAPEQTGRTGHCADQRADLYSLGATLYELATGQPPFAGVGKSALAAELRPAATAAGGWYIQGKFDQYQQDADGSGVFTDAFREFARHLLAEPADTLPILRDRLLQALGQGASLITRAFPEFAMLLGKVADSVELNQAQVEDQMQQAVVDMLGVVSSAGRSLVLVLDDLQWAPVQALPATPGRGRRGLGNGRSLAGGEDIRRCNRSGQDAPASMAPRTYHRARRLLSPDPWTDGRGSRPPEGCQKIL